MERRNDVNREWHEKNKMPAGTTEKERIAWHLEHTAHCACRPFPEGLVAKMSAAEQRKLAHAAKLRETAAKR